MNKWFLFTLSSTVKINSCISVRLQKDFSKTSFPALNVVCDGIFVCPYQLWFSARNTPTRNVIHFHPDQNTHLLGLSLVCLLICYYGNLHELAHRILLHFPPEDSLCSGVLLERQYGGLCFLSVLKKMLLSEANCINKIYTGTSVLKTNKAKLVFCFDWCDSKLVDNCLW